jgi:hypothetical protein
LGKNSEFLNVMAGGNHYVRRVKINSIIFRYPENRTEATEIKIFA